MKNEEKKGDSSHPNRLKLIHSCLKQTLNITTKSNHQTIVRSSKKKPHSGSCDPWFHVAFQFRFLLSACKKFQCRAGRQKSNAPPKRRRSNCDLRLMGGAT